VTVGYGVGLVYTDRNGEHLFSVSIPSEMISAAQVKGYSYKTPRDTFEKVLSLFGEEFLPYEMISDCFVTVVSLSEDGNTLIYDLTIEDVDSSYLNNLTPGFLKSYMRKLLPNIPDIPFRLAKDNGLDVSFVFHAAGHDRWERTATFTEKDYNAK
jgi:hypothetical protein